MNELRKGAVEVAQVIRDAGYEVYYAGGCVRDLLLGLSPKDFDIVTNATPKQVDSLFRKTVLVGANFGVVRVLWSKRREYEIATYRREGKYSDGRRPDEVIYSDSKKEDVQRRDFTINALLMDPFSEEIYDFVSGQDDLKKKEIRAVGHAETRFQEDRLRLLRAVRFAARFDFQIEEETFESICRNSQHIREVSVERIVAELDGIWKCMNPSYGYRLLLETGLAQTVFSELTSDNYETINGWMTNIGNFSESMSEQRVIVCWAMFAYFHKRDKLETWLATFKLSRARIRAVQKVLSLHDTLKTFSVVPVAEKVRLVRDERFHEALCLFQSTHADSSLVVQECDRLSLELKDNPLPTLPLIDGKDLASMGFRPGPLFKTILRKVEDLILERKIVSKEEAKAWILAQDWN